MYCPLDEFKKLPATHVVSLGESCATAYNLRRHYNFGGAFPFDWWVSEAEGLIRFLDDPRVDRLYDPEKLGLTDNGGSVRHKEFGLLLHHEFPRAWRREGGPIRDDWRDFLAKPKHRSAALVKKFLDLNKADNRIVFVRYGKSAPGFIERLEKLFVEPTWTFVHLGYIANKSGGWKGDPQAWDRVLDDLSLSIDLTGHKPFVETDPDVEFVAPSTPSP